MRSPKSKKLHRPEKNPGIHAGYRSAIVRAALSTAAELAAASGAAIGRKRLINFLRGNVFPSEAEAASKAMVGFALLQSHRAGWVEAVVDRLIEDGYLTANGGRSTISLSELGAQALLEDAPLPENILPEAPKLGAHPALEERLRALRVKLAAAEGLAPYGIFHNKTLAELASRRPKNVADLASVPGLGESRVRKYGRKILEAFKG